MRVIKYIVENTKIDLKAINKVGNNYVHLSTENDNLDIFQYILDKSQIDLNDKNNDGNTPLHRACMNNFFIILIFYFLFLLFLFFFIFLFFWKGAFSKNLDVIKSLFNKKIIEAETTNNYGNTLIHLASEHNDVVDIIKYIIENTNIDVNSVNNDGNTAFHRAC